MFLQVIGAGAFAESGYVGEIVVEREADNGAGLEAYERAIMLQCLVKLWSNADGDGFALGGAGSIAPQGCGEVTVAAVLSVELLENGCFVAGILGEQGVDLLAEGFSFGLGFLSVAVLNVGERAYETLLEACDTEAPAAEGAEVLIAPGNML